MAHFTSTVTYLGLSAIAQAVGDLTKIRITRAELGEGFFGGGDPAALPGVISPLAKTPQLGKKKVHGSRVLVPVQVTNEGVAEPTSIREIALFADTDAGEICFAYAWSTDGDDAVNTLSPPGTGAQNFDQLRIVDVNIFVESPEEAGVTVHFSASALVTWQDMVDYAAQIAHRHAAEQVDESTGENTEQAQRRQDWAIAALQQATGSTLVIRSFDTPAAIAQWTIEEGVLQGDALTTGGNV